MLGHAHGAYLGCDIGTDFSGQNQAKNRIRKLKQNDIAGSQADRIGRNQRRRYVELHLDGNNRTDEKGYHNHKWNGVHSELDYLLNRAAPEYIPLVRQRERTLHQKRILAKLLERFYQNHNL